jgi:tryptophan synthase alpha chain
VTIRSNSGEAPPSHPPAPGPDSATGEELEAPASPLPGSDASKLSGIERIAAAFRAARDENRAALMPYMMAGYPDTESSLAIAGAYVDAGADLVELGVPFSDPLADGPVIHAAATEALAAGATRDTALEVCESIAARAPVVLMAYSNMILACGATEFARRAADAGAAGAIVPDLPLDEADEIRSALGATGLALVPLLAPTTTPERRGHICAAASGFVYVVSSVGTTGERQQLPPGLAELVAAAKEEAEAPVAVGFGIGTPQQAAEVGEIADGVIIGSRLVRAAGEARSAAAAADAVGAFLRDARAALVA